MVSREERQWREWVDTKLVHTLSPNIYRTLGESLQAFDYISSVGNFNMMERVLAKYIGAVVMYILSKRLKKKYVCIVIILNISVIIMYPDIYIIQIV